MRKVFSAILAMLLFASPAIGASVYSCTQSIQASGAYKIYNMVWTSADPAGFTATATTQEINGIVMLVEFVPSATVAPTDNYDIVLRNDQGIDILGDSGAAGSEAYDGSGANKDTAVPSQSQPLLNGNYGAVPVYGVLTLYVYNMGAAKGGTVRIHYLSIN